jgi:hypothetical protein
MINNINTKIVNKYETVTLKQFLQEYNCTKEDYYKSNHIQFRYMCYKMIPFIKSVLLPKIPKKSCYESVFIEFRIFPHIEFLIRNAILKLGSSWSFTIICGTTNYEFILNICNTISPNINIIKYDVYNINQQEYSDLLMTKEFWNNFHGDKILIQQEDTLMFKNNIMDFIKYDYIGAPFPSDSNDTPNKVGNGGFSLRTKSKMTEVITKCDINNFFINSSTEQYMRYRNLKNPPEDIYFSKNLQDFDIGTVADWTVASTFSSESVFNKDSLGCHKLWSCTKEWKQHIKNMFHFKIYKHNSHIKKYLHFLNKPEILDITKDRNNAFDIDFYFYSKANNIDYKKPHFLIDHMYKNGLHGFLYHPKQLLNLYPDLQFYTFLNNIYTVDNNCAIYTIQEFVNKYIYNSGFDYLTELSISKKYCNLNCNYSLLLLVFIGDEKIGVDLINKITEYKKIENEMNVAFCFHKNIYNSSTDLKKMIKDNFEFYSIYISNEFGNDILPTLLMYNDINKKHEFKHIIKLHTKTNKVQYENYTNFLLNVPINVLTTQKMDNCNCIGYTYIDNSQELLNNEIKKLYQSQINMNYLFVPGTIFYTNNIVLNAVLYLMKNISYRAFFLNNLYDTNAINDNFSPIHFLERLFGIIKL